MISQLELEISQDLEQGEAGAARSEPEPAEENMEEKATGAPKPSKRACAKSNPHHECGREQPPPLPTGPVIAEEKKEQAQGGRPAPTKPLLTPPLIAEGQKVPYPNPNNPNPDANPNPDPDNPIPSPNLPHNPNHDPRSSLRAALLRRRGGRARG